MKPMEIILAVILTLSAIAFVTSARAADELVSVRRDYYAILGSTAAELRAQMSAKGPLVPGHGLKRGRVWAQTTYAYAEFSTKPCRVKLIATQALPRWENEANGPPELQKMWGEFSAMLTEHEDGHVEIMREAIANLDALKCRSSINKAWGIARAKDQKWDAAAKHNTRLETTR